MLPSIIRTIVPLIVGAVVAAAARHGIDLPEDALAEVVTPVVTVAAGAAYYAAVRFVETRLPGPAGRILLGLGVVRQQPVYTDQATPSE